MADRRRARLRDVFGSRTGAILAVVVLCSLLLSSCGDLGDILADLFNINGNDAMAQGDRLIETFVIQAGTFRLEVDVEPDPIEIFDGATRYTLGAGNSDLSFTEEGAAAPTNIDLESGDIVIERPASGVVTVIRDNPE